MSKESPTFEEQTADQEPKIRQKVNVIGRTVLCFACPTKVKELAQYYCACGAFLCLIHLGNHKCLVTSSLEYGDEVRRNMV